MCPKGKGLFGRKPESDFQLRGDGSWNQPISKRVGGPPSIGQTSTAIGSMVRSHVQPPSSKAPEGFVCMSLWRKPPPPPRSDGKRELNLLTPDTTNSLFFFHNLIVFPEGEVRHKTTIWLFSLREKSATRLSWYSSAHMNRICFFLQSCPLNCAGSQILQTFLRLVETEWVFFSFPGIVPDFEATVWRYETRHSKWDVTIWLHATTGVDHVIPIGETPHNFNKTPNFLTLQQCKCPFREGNRKPGWSHPNNKACGRSSQVSKASRSSQTGEQVFITCLYLGVYDMCTVVYGVILVTKDLHIRRNPLWTGSNWSGETEMAESPLSASRCSSIVMNPVLSLSTLRNWPLRDSTLESKNTKGSVSSHLLTWELADVPSRKHLFDHTRSP